jgi:hypothetical protein
LSRPAPSISIDEQLCADLAALNAALGTPVVLAGGWAVQCRLRMGRASIRATEDLDVILSSHHRPAKDRLEAIGVRQDDPRHSCRLLGRTTDIDLLADDDPPVLQGHLPSRVVEDQDGLRLLRSPQAQLLVRGAEPVLLTGGSITTDVLLPRAGALVAAKMANLTLENRGHKLKSDAIDVVNLLAVFGTLGLLEDLQHATDEERTALLKAMEVIGPTAVHALTDGHSLDLDRVVRPFHALQVRLRSSP